ncbi:helix-turn-helix domain-containing protein [Sporosarcina ureae]|uniref:helix-turn-helix domain-containing protein n=1 Tax=Sporosarcina ureae TaxID=1571 RepID=UPI000A17B850|nr:helix-turn-helix domain-containing protein [Sporosarcina ureae]ARK21856.1 hypothetical protein SporoP32a_10175 [Sporosarcina ureae]
MDNYIDEYLTIAQVCKKLRLNNVNDVYLLIEKRCFSSAVKINNLWHITVDDVEKYEQTLNVVASCLTIKQAAGNSKYGNKSITSIRTLIRNSRLPNAFKFNGEWWIPKSDLKQLAIEESKLLNTTQAYKQLNLTSHRNILNLINKGIFPNAFKDFNLKWKIPLKDIEEYEEK